MKKAQIWSMDFAVSILIFFSVVVVLIFFFNNTLSQNTEQSEIFKIQKTALRVSDSLIRIPGTPANWTSDNVLIIGLAIEDNMLDEEKVKEFVSMNYEKARPLLVGRYQFHFEIRDLNDTLINIRGTNVTQGTLPTSANIVIPIERYVFADEGGFTNYIFNESGGILQSPIAYGVFSPENYILEVLNDSSEVWDLYWCSSNPMPSTNARNAYQIPDQKECFGDMIENRSGYVTIAVEDPGIAETDFSPGDPKLNLSHKQWLKDFVLDGNRYVQDEHGDVACMFNMSGCGESLGLVGIVESLEYLTNVSIGEEITFIEAPSVLYSAPGDNDLNIQISEKNNPSRALFGYWDYGSGRVFYIADFESTGNIIEKLNLESGFSIRKIPIGKLRLIVWT